MDQGTRRYFTETERGVMYWLQVGDYVSFGRKLLLLLGEHEFFPSPLRKLFWLISNGEPTNTHILIYFPTYF